MKFPTSLLVNAALAAAGMLTMSGAHAQGTSDAQSANNFRRPDPSHAVFVMTNDADANEVMAFENNGHGALREPRTYRTGGRGSGGKVDPLASQGSLTLSKDGSWLFAANAGSGSLSVFRVHGSRLDLTDKAPTQGSEPNAVAEHDNLVYVLNTAGSSSVVGFRLHGGHLYRIKGSQRFLSGNGTGSASVAFSPDGRFLLVTERTSNSIDVFAVSADGRLSSITTNPSAGTGAFSVAFAPNGAAIVSEIGPPGPNASTVSSYKVRSDRTLQAISTGVPTLGAANCWNAITPNGRFAYVSNSGSSSISGFAVGNAGALTPLPGTVVASSSEGTINIDIAISADGAFLYSLNAGAGSIGVFAIDSKSGALRNLGTVDGLPASAGLNGIAAN